MQMIRRHSYGNPFGHISRHAVFWMFLAAACAIVAFLIFTREAG